MKSKKILSNVRSNTNSATPICKRYQPLFQVTKGSTVNLKYWKGYQIAVVKDNNGKIIYFYGSNIKKRRKKNGH